MEDDKKPTETTEVVGSPEAGTQPVETTETVDYEAKLQEVINVAEQLAAEKKKAEEERDNYKNGMLSAKSKIKQLKDDGYAIDDEDTTDKNKELIERMASIESLVKTALQKEQVVEDTNTKLNKTISELKISLANRAPATSASAGSGSSDKPAVTTSKWSHEQLVDLKRRGLDPEEVWKRSQKPQIMWQGESN